jgi:hypothetical protein
MAAGRQQSSRKMALRDGNTNARNLKSFPGLRPANFGSLCFMDAMLQGRLHSSGSQHDCPASSYCTFLSAPFRDALNFSMANTRQYCSFWALNLPYIHPHHVVLMPVEIISPNAQMPRTVNSNQSPSWFSFSYSRGTTYCENVADNAANTAGREQLSMSYNGAVRTKTDHDTQKKMPNTIKTITMVSNPANMNNRALIATSATKNPLIPPPAVEQCDSCLYTGVATCTALSLYFFKMALLDTPETFKSQTARFKAHTDKRFMLAFGSCWAVAGVYRLYLG